MFNNSFSEDITPPKLTFKNAESLTNGTAVINWMYDEIATSKCTLATPSHVKNVNCSNNEWKESSLSEGSYILWVYGTDEANNTDLAGKHSWRVGEYMSNQYCLYLLLTVNARFTTHSGITTLFHKIFYKRPSRISEK